LNVVFVSVNFEDFSFGKLESLCSDVAVDSNENFKFASSKEVGIVLSTDDGFSISESAE
jgi:hypothetical protein